MPQKKHRIKFKRREKHTIQTKILLGSWHAFRYCHTFSTNTGNIVSLFAYSIWFGRTPFDLQKWNESLFYDSVLFWMTIFRSLPLSSIWAYEMRRLSCNFNSQFRCTVAETDEHKNMAKWTTIYLFSLNIQHFIGHSLKYHNKYTICICVCVSYSVLYIQPAAIKLFHCEKSQHSKFLAMFLCEKVL